MQPLQYFGNVAPFWILGPLSGNWSFAAKSWRRSCMAFQYLHTTSIRQLVIYIFEIVLFIFLTLFSSDHI